MTQKLDPGLTKDEGCGVVEALSTWEPQGIDFDLLTSAFRIHGRYCLSWWDALIVAAAVAMNCDEILSEDLSITQVYEGIPLVNPFG